MTIEEVKIKKQEFDNSLISLISEFQKDTGLTIDSIEVISEEISLGRKIYSVNSSVVIKTTVVFK